MNRTEFLNDQDVTAFVKWLTVTLPRLPIRLRIHQSRFVPEGIHEDIIGIDNVLDHYVWKSTGMLSGNWN